MIDEAKPWVLSYDPGIEACIDISATSLKQVFVDTFRRYRDSIAVCFMDKSITYGQLLEQSGCFARALADAGFGKRDVVAIGLPNIPQYLVAMIGAMRAGCTVSGLPPLLTTEEMAYQLNDCGAAVLVTLEDLFAEKVVPIDGLVNKLKMVLVTTVQGGGSDTDGFAVDGFFKKRVESFNRFLEGADNQPPDIDIECDDICFIQYTGGTTGQSKGALLTHRNMVSNVKQFEHWLQAEPGAEVFVSGFPFYHQGGLIVACCSLAWGGTQSLIPDSRNISHIMDEMKRHQPTYITYVPSVFFSLLNESGFKGIDFSNTKYCITGASSIPFIAFEELESVIGVNKIIEVWGLTETSPLITANPVRNKKKSGSVGLPLPCTSVCVVSLEDGKTELPFFSEGELICSGPQVMKGYLNKPEETEKVLQMHDDRLWMHTGDIGYMDNEGYVYVVDRIKDMLIVGGYKVFSSEVEDKIFKHPAVAMCALVGVPNPDRPDSQIVKLIVKKSEEFRDQPDDVVRNDILAFAKGILAPYKVPGILKFVDHMPMTSVGKINKKAMRA